MAAPDPILVVSALWFYVTTIALVGFVAAEKGRSGIGWAALSFFLTPWACLIALAALPTREGANA